MLRKILATCVTLSLVLATFQSVPLANAMSFWAAFQGGYIDYGLHPMNLSTTTTCLGAGGHVRTQIEVVTSVFQYDYDRAAPSEEFVYFRVAVYVKAFADPGYEADCAYSILLYLDKIDSNHENTWTVMRNDQGRAVSQGYCLSQQSSMPSTPSERADWVRIPLEFAAGMLSDGVATVLFLMEWSQSFGSVPELDYRDAGHEDSYAFSYWRDGAPNNNTPPYRQYCFNVFYWRMDGDVIPALDYGLRISAYVVPFNTLIINPFYTLPIDLHIYPQGGGGGCPFVSTWNGFRYSVDNNILPAAELSRGTDVEDYCRLRRPLAALLQSTTSEVYSLRISEFEQEHDYIDKVKLLRVSHPSKTQVAVTPDGEILTYSNPFSPTVAVDDANTDVLPKLNAVDGEYYCGHDGSYVTLSFSSLDTSGGATLVIVDDNPPHPKCPIYVQILVSSDKWTTVATFLTRKYWATDVIDLREHWPDSEGKLRVRLCFTSTDKIEYVGLDTTRPREIQIQEASLIAAIHTKKGDVSSLLSENDQHYAELVCGECIYLAFLLARNRGQESTFVLYSNGHYVLD